LWLEFITNLNIIRSRSDVVFLVSLFEKASCSMDSISHCSDLWAYFYLSL